MGRQSTYTEAVADEIVQRLSEGEPLAVICRDEGMPSRDTVYDWEKAITGFAPRIARARELGYDAIATNCLEIADDGRNDTYETEDGTRTNVDVIQRSKLRVETRLKLLAKWSPRYADKLTHEGGEKPINITIRDSSKLLG